MAQLLLCPFCNSDGEIYKDRTYPTKYKTFATETQAENWIAEMRKKYIIKESNVICTYRKRVIKYRARIERQAFIPRCTKSGCLGRNVILFPTQEAAEAAWNRRADHDDN